MTEDIGEETKIVLFMFMLLSNIVFGIAWIYGLLEAVAIKLMEKRPTIAKKLCCCLFKSRGFRNLAKELGVDMRLFDVALGPAPENHTTMTYDDIKPYPATPVASMIS